MNVSFLRLKHRTPGILLALTVVGYPVAGLLSAAIDVPGNVTSTPFRLLVMAIAFYVLMAFRHERRFGFWPGLLIVWWCFYAFRLIANVIHGYPGANHELLFYGAVVILPSFALLVCDSSRRDGEVGYLIIFLGAMVVGGAIIGELLGVFNSHSLMFTGRLSTDTVNPITLGHVAVSTLLSLMVMKQVGGIAGAVTMVVVAGASLVCMSLTGSRGPFLALIAALTFFILAYKKPLMADISQKIAPGLIVFTLILFFFPISTEQLIINSDIRRISSNREMPIPKIKSIDTDTQTVEKLKKIDAQAMNKEMPVSKIKSIDDTQSAERSIKIGAQTIERLKRIDELNVSRLTFTDAAATERRKLMNGAFEQFQRHPLTGGSNWEASSGVYPHNLQLEAFSNLGVLGGVAFLLLDAAGLYYAWKRIQEGQYLVPLLFVQAVVSSLFSGSLYGHAQLWATLAILLRPSASDRGSDEQGRLHVALRQKL